MDNFSLRVAGAQVPVHSDIESNVKTITRAINFAALQKADILLTPEGSLSGYTHAFDTAAAEQAPTASRAASMLPLGARFKLPATMTIEITR